MSRDPSYVTRIARERIPGVCPANDQKTAKIPPAMMNPRKPNTIAVAAKASSEHKRDHGCDHARGDQIDPGEQSEADRSGGQPGRQASLVGLRFVIAAAHDPLEYVVQGFRDLRQSDPPSVIRQWSVRRLRRGSPGRRRPAPPA